MTWLSTAAHARWLESETDRLLAFGRASRVADGGFGWLGEDGRIEADRPRELYLTCRMTYCFALGSMLGRPGDGLLVDHGVAALTELFRDGEHGGWFASLGATDPEPVDDTKAAYGHAFVVLAAAAATAARRPGAAGLLADALEVSLSHFWDDAAGMVVESWDRAFATGEAYRGVNAAMHTVEAYLAAADVTGDRAWLDRAARSTERVVGLAAESSWRIPEHFDELWQPLPEYNADSPAHPFRPYGATVGHGLEWARLALHVRAALAVRDGGPPDWLLDGAIALFDAATREGWSVDGGPGFVYTVDRSGRPVVRERMHWVLCEAIGAAAALHTVTGDPQYDDWYRTWWDHAGERYLDLEGGSWWHELDAAGQVSRTVWSGKPDVYHALQATLIPRLPLAPVLAPALARGLLG